MIGYHYTSYSNWLSIKKFGLFPYLIDKPELKVHFSEPVHGIWIWPSNLQGIEHVGSILWQLGTKGETRLVKLHCQFDESSLLKRDKDRLILTHDGTIGDWRYHQDTPSLIVTKKISASKIKKVGDYDLIKLLSNNKIYGLFQ